MSQSQSPRSVADVIDDLGFGGAQVRLVLLASGSAYVSGISMCLFETLPSSMALDLGLHQFQRAMLFSTLLAGKMTGNVFGMVTNTLWGRRFPILFAYSCILIALPLIPFCYSFYLILILIFVCAFGPGWSCVHLYPLLSEASPTSKRFAMNAATNVYFCFGCMQVLVVEYFYSTTLEFGHRWREVIWVAFTPALFLYAGVLMFSFVDSAHLYVAKGEFGKTRRILESMRDQNGRHDVSIEFAEAEGGLVAEPASMYEAIYLMFTGQFLSITCVMCMLTLTINSTYYGVGYAMPIVLQDVALDVSPALVLLIIPVIEVFGYLNAVMLSNWIGRRALLLGFLCAGVAVFMSMAFGLFKLQSTPKDSTGQIMVLLACLLFKFILAHGWQVIYMYLAEVYPTTCRGSAMALAIAFGRVGSISTPFIFEHLHLLTGQHMVFFLFGCGLMTVDALASYFILPETKGKKLEVFATPLDAGETTPLRKK